MTAVGNGCPPVIRPAVAADVPEIAALCLHSWRQTYRGLLADDFLDGLVPEDLAVHWRKYIGSAENGLFVLQEQGAVRGFAACGIDRQLENCAYLDALHVADEARGRGFGSDLLRQAAVWGSSAGLRQMSVCIVRGNEPARRLYEKLGAVHWAYFQDDFHGTPSQSEKLLWLSAAFEALCRGTV